MIYGKNGPQVMEGVESKMIDEENGGMFGYAYLAIHCLLSLLFMRFKDMPRNIYYLPVIYLKKPYPFLLVLSFFPSINLR